MECLPHICKTVDVLPGTAGKQKIYQYDEESGGCSIRMAAYEFQELSLTRYEEPLSDENEWLGRDQIPSGV